MPPGGRIKDSDVDAVRERTDIVQLISEYVPLKKSGREFRGPCPFHQEKEPSFYVNPAKGVYFCFGCKAAGGVFNFVMQLEGLNFNEAIERLADRIGYQVTYMADSPSQKKARSEKERLYRLNQTVMDYFQYLLRESGEGRGARAYLEGRGFGESIIDEFHLGYSTPEWDSMSKFLLKKGFKEPELVKAGLARERPRKSGSGPGVYDIFRNRIMFPILDNRGRVVAFGGRRLEEESAEGEPKYLNSPETPVYRKGRTLYGYPQARTAIQNTAEAVVVEGYTDLLALWQAGMKEVVATLGTALTENHFELLNRICERVYLAFDADRAGTDAARRPIEFWNRFRMDVYVMNLPQGQDPASLVEEGGIEVFMKLKESAEPLLDFAAKKVIERYDVSTPIGRRRAMEACVPVIAKVSGDDVAPIRNDLVRKIAGWLDMPEDTVLFYLREASRASRTPSRRVDDVRVPVMSEKAEREALRLLLQSPDALIQHCYLDSDYFTDEKCKKIFEMLKEISTYDEKVLQAEYDGIIRRMVENIEGSDLRGFATQLLIEPLPDCDQGYEDKVFDRLTYMFFKRRKQRIEFDLRKVDKNVEPKKYNALCDQLIELAQVMKEQFPFDHG